MQREPRIPKSDAAQLITLAQAVVRDAGTDGCAARTDIGALSTQARQLVAAGRVPLRLQTQLLNGIAALAAEAPACAPPPTVAPAPQPKQGKPPKHDHGHGHGHGDGQGNNGGD